jgi:NADH-quinone oxidoreductase subunit N
MIFASCISILVGSVGALYQTKVKRLLAYSAIANLGYIVLGLCSSSIFGIFASFYYILIYIITSINIFSILLFTRRYPLKSKFKNLVEFVSIPHSNFILCILLVFSLLSMAGIPPLSGFFGKFTIFLALINKGYYLLALYAVLFSVLTSVYYIRLIRFI